VISQRPLADPSLLPLAADRTRLYRAPDHGQRAWIVHQASVEAESSRLLQRLVSDPSGLRSSVVLQPEGEGKDSASPFRGKDSSSTSSDRLLTDGDSGEPVRIVHRTATRIAVQAWADRAGYLVLGETWAPGWRAWRDGQPVGIRRANLVHRAVELPAGHHRVEFRYEPAAFRLGLYLSLSALAALLAMAVARAGRSR
jgi:hypothetical protein